VTGRLLKVRNVTDRARLRRRFRTLIERSSDVVFLLDEAGVIEYASPSVRRVLGYDPGTLVGDRTFEPLTVGDVHRIESVRETATGEMPAGAATEGRTAATETWYRILGKREGADADTVRFEVVLRTDDGSERTIEAYARYLVDDPAAEGIVINARDITERRGASANWNGRTNASTGSPASSATTSATRLASPAGTSNSPQRATPTPSTRSENSTTAWRR
jgi:PAS domain-containing protein